MSEDAQLDRWRPMAWVLIATVGVTTTAVAVALGVPWLRALRGGAVFAAVAAIVALLVFRTRAVARRRRASQGHRKRSVPGLGVILVCLCMVFFVLLAATCVAQAVTAARAQSALEDNRVCALGAEADDCLMEVQGRARLRPVQSGREPADQWEMHVAGRDALAFLTDAEGTRVLRTFDGTVTAWLYDGEVVAVRTDGGTVTTFSAGSRGVVYSLSIAVMTAGVAAYFAWVLWRPRKADLLGAVVTGLCLFTGPMVAVSVLSGGTAWWLAVLWGGAAMTATACVGWAGRWWWLRRRRSG